jgi:hypothetical protein
VASHLDKGLGPHRTTPDCAPSFKKFSAASLTDSRTALVSSPIATATDIFREVDFASHIGPLPFLSTGNPEPQLSKNNYGLYIPEFYKK